MTSATALCKHLYLVPDKTKHRDISAQLLRQRPNKQTTNPLVSRKHHRKTSSPLGLRRLRPAQVRDPREQGERVQSGRPQTRPGRRQHAGQDQAHKHKGEDPEDDRLLLREATEVDVDAVPVERGNDAAPVGGAARERGGVGDAEGAVGVDGEVAEGLREGRELVGLHRPEEVLALVSQLRSRDLSYMT
jgi:hypothetical protein